MVDDPTLDHFEKQLNRVKKADEETESTKAAKRQRTLRRRINKLDDEINPNIDQLTYE